MGNPPILDGDLLLTYNDFGNKIEKGVLPLPEVTMGGLGSGRRADPAHRKKLVEECITADIRHLVRRGLLERGESFRDWGEMPEDEDGEVTVYDFTIDDPAAEPVDPSTASKVLTIRHLRSSGGGYTVRDYEFVTVTTTRLFRGGERHWLQCPGHGPDSSTTCGRRVACLYLPRGGRRFLCRRCHNLTNTSQQTWNSYQRKSGPPARPAKRRGKAKMPWDDQVTSSVFETVEDPPAKKKFLDEDPEAIAVLAVVKSKLSKLGFTPGKGEYDRTIALVSSLLRKR